MEALLKVPFFTIYFTIFLLNTFIANVYLFEKKLLKISVKFCLYNEHTLKFLLSLELLYYIILTI